MHGKMRRDMPLPAGVQLLQRRHDVTIAADGGAMIQIWHATATLDSMALCEAALERMAAEQARYVTLTVVENSVTAPDAAVRQAAGRIAARFEARSLGNALVIEGGDFKHMGIRLALTTIHLISPPIHSTPVFARVEEASKWLAERLPELSLLQLARDVTSLRATG